MKKNGLPVLLILLMLLAACQDAGQGPNTDQGAEGNTPAPAIAEPPGPTAETVAVPTETTEETTEMPESEPTEESRIETVSQELSVELTDQLDAFLQSQVYSEGGNPEGAAPGLVLYVRTPEGTYLNAAGVSSLEDGTSMQVDDRLEIGSNSKSFTIAVLMQLQEEGLLSFDDQLSDWLPDLAAADSQWPADHAAPAGFAHLRHLGLRRSDHRRGSERSRQTAGELYAARTGAVCHRQRHARF